MRNQPVMFASGTAAIHAPSSSGAYTSPPTPIYTKGALRALDPAQHCANAENPILALKIPQTLRMDFFRRQLANVEALPQLVLIAVITGVLTGTVVLIFRVAVEIITQMYLTSGGASATSESFETLSQDTRFALAAGGALLIGVLLNRFPAQERRLGVVHVMERLSRHQGYLTLKSAMIQFFGGILALISGQSGGREGPAVHLGAATASLLGQGFALPNNSIRTLVACGTAAAIASSFNTPMAGVIFAMEVVMMEYTISSFLPVIVAAVSSTILTQYLLGNEPVFSVVDQDLATLLELPYIALGGLVIGSLAAAFIVLVQQFTRLSHWPFWMRATLAGVITGGAAWYVPQVMGVGYDTVNFAISGDIAWQALLFIVAFKLVTSAATTGLGLPLGLIGPTLMIGACVGGVLGALAQLYGPPVEISVGLYVMLGMCAMMAATLQAPLAALMAVLELTANPNIILPAMLIIAVATLVTSELFRQKSIYISTLKTMGLQYPPNPVALHLQRAAVLSIMERHIVRANPDQTVEQASKVLEGQPLWVLIETEPGAIKTILKAADLMAYLKEGEDGDDPPDAEEPINLLALPGMRMDVVSIDSRATIHEAQELLNRSGAEALLVRRTSAPLIAPVLGVVTQDAINNFREV